MKKIILLASLAVAFSANYALAQRAPAPAGSVVTAPADTGYENDHDYAGANSMMGGAGDNGSDSGQ